MKNKAALRSSEKKLTTNKQRTLEASAISAAKTDVVADAVADNDADADADAAAELSNFLLIVDCLHPFNTNLYKHRTKPKSS